MKCQSVVLQLLTKAGLLNVPAWYAAGKVSAEQSGIDWRASLLFIALAEQTLNSKPVQVMATKISMLRLWRMQGRCCSCSLHSRTLWRSSGTRT